VSVKRSVASETPYQRRRERLTIGRNPCGATGAHALGAQSGGASVTLVVLSVRRASACRVRCFDVAHLGRLTGCLVVASACVVSAAFASSGAFSPNPLPGATVGVTGTAGVTGGTRPTRASAVGPMASGSSHGPTVASGVGQSVSGGSTGPTRGGRAKRPSGRLPATGASGSPSGVGLPVGNLAGWRQIYANDFTSGSWTSEFSTYGEIPDTSRNGWLVDGESVSQANGLLNVFVHTDSQGRHVGAALVPVRPGVSMNHGQLYGRYDLRMRADPAQGYKAVFILWPDSNSWPQDGEIDFPEADLAATRAGGATHFEHGTSANSQDWWVDPGFSYSRWHTYTIEWSPGLLNYYIDGRLVHSDTTATAARQGFAIPNTPMHPVIQIETATDGSGAPSNTSHGNVQIDWLAAYSYNP
jgi:Glycosyl hydrolases family 16